MKRKYIITLLVAALLAVFGAIGGTVWALFFAHPKVDVQTAEVEKRTLDETVDASGAVTPAAKINVVSKLTAKITAVALAQGDKVKAGQLICQLDTTELDLQVQEAQASLDQAEANRDKVVRALQQGGTLSQPATAGGSAAVQYTQEDKQAAEAQVDQAQAALDLARASQQSAAITAPVDGTVVELHAVQGEMASPEQPLAVIVDPLQMYIEANVDEADISKVKLGQKVKVRLDAYPNKALVGEVVEIGSTSTATKAGGTAYPVKVRFVVLSGATLRSGMNGDADIIVATLKKVIAVPVDAVTEKDGKTVVFVVRSSLIHKGEVKLGISTEDYYEIKSGLSEKELIVTKDVDELEGGEKVR